MTSLPLDLVLEIAAFSDPATLVRCAATCRDVRRRMTDDPTFYGRLRLGHADRFVPSLIRGFLIKRWNKYNKDELHLVDTTTTTTAADATVTSKLVTVADGFPPPDDDEPSSARRQHKLLASRDGLVLVHAYGEQLRVCDPATGHSRTLPPEPAFFEGAQANSCWEPYVFLVGGGAGAVGRRRPFQVLKTNLALSFDCRYLQIHTFSSEKGTWSPYVKIQTPEIRGFRLLRGGGRPLVTAAGSMVHWLCLTDAACYVLSLDASTAQVSVTALPRSFPRMDYVNNDRKYLLATTPTGERPVVLVADRDRISLWTQTSKLTAAKWKQRPEVVSMNETLVRLGCEGGVMQRWSMDYCNTEARLHWFAERSGVALIEMTCHGFFLFDLSSKEILRRFSHSQLTSYPATCCPYEMDLSSWVPTFTCNL